MFAIPLHERLRYDTGHSPVRGIPAPRLDAFERRLAAGLAKADPPHREDSPCPHDTHGSRCTASGTPSSRRSRLAPSSRPRPTVRRALRRCRRCSRESRCEIVLDNGPALGYRFADRNRLSLAEGDAAAVQAGYGALTLDRLVAVLAHGAGHAARIHGRHRSGHESRHRVRGVVQRLRGQPRSAAADLLRLRRAGRQGPRPRRGTASPTASKARASTGSRTPASRRSSSTRRVMYSNFVELTRFGGELSFCAPSDYVKINDDLVHLLARRGGVLRHDDHLRARREPRRADRRAPRLRRDRHARVLPVHGTRRVGRPDRAVRAVRRRGARRSRLGNRPASTAEGRAPRLSAAARPTRS